MRSLPLSRKHFSPSHTEAEQHGLSAAKMYGLVHAMERVQAIVHFSPEGVILDANENFLKTMGYTMAEIRGQHHRIFVDPEFARSRAYQDFWAKLARGEFDRSEYKRIGKGGKEVWLLASYNPILDEHGKLIEIAKFATDITEQKLRALNYEGLVTAIDRVQGVIEFTLDGAILKANKVFLDLMGYTKDEVVGRHHSMFVEPGYEKSPDYEDFWRRLRAGHPDVRVFKRYGKHQHRVWIQASYNPIFDQSGKPYKVIKFASDITAIIDQTESTQESAQSVATAAEELSSSIAEISKSMETSRHATMEITNISAKSGQDAALLTGSVKDMESIVSLIREIAGRVNMLSLNAAIEAARAGEAGRGFAVVAGEVRSLADQTAKATNQIGEKIKSIQTTAAKVEQNIVATESGISQVNSSIGSVAAAIEQQTAVTKEIAQHSTGLVTSVQAIMEHTVHGGAERDSNIRRR